MAREPQNTPELIPAAMRAHMQDLGFHRLDHYCEWCWDNGFVGNLDKSKSDLQDELEAYAEIQKKIARQASLHKRPKAFLKAVCEGEISSDEIVRPNFKRVAEEIETSNENPEVRQSLLEMLIALIRYKALIFEICPDDDFTPFIRGLIKLHDRKALWLQQIENWKPKSKNSERQFGELTHFLFDKYGDVPRFMERVWLRNDRSSWRYRDWYVHLGRGHNLRTAKSPVPITKKMAHYFLQAPEDYTPEQAIRFAQLKTLGADRALIDAVVATPLGRSFENETFWFSVMRFLSNAPMLDPRQVGPIYDYIHHQKFQPNEVEVAPGDWRTEPPPQPGFSMTGRDITTLLRHVEEWHIALGKQKSLPTTAYERSSYQGFSAQVKQGEKTIYWMIRQLMNGQALQRESEAMRHCVASYHYSCSKGLCTIWSLSRSEDGKNYQRSQTIEIDSSGVIIQCRGLANSDPSAEEWKIVTNWARQENIPISNYL